MFNRRSTSRMRLPSWHLLLTALFLSIQMLLSSFVEAVRKGELNHDCQLVTDCRTPAYFCGRNRTCQCAKNHIPNEIGTICIGAIGEKCRYDSHCGEGAYCSPREVCECQLEYPFSTEDGYACTDAAASNKNSAATWLMVIICVVTVLTYLRIQ